MRGGKLLYLHGNYVVRTLVSSRSDSDLSECSLAAGFTFWK